MNSDTTQRSDYQAWPGITPPKKKERIQWVSTSGKFNGTSITKADYVEFAVPHHYTHHQPPYVKSDAKFEGLSTQVEDYKSWNVSNVPTRRKTAIPPTITADDR